MTDDDDKPLWYVRRSATVQGPYSARDMRRYLLLGRLRLSDRVSADALRWEPLTQRVELIPEEMTNLGSEEGRARFEAARRAVDERAAEREPDPTGRTTPVAATIAPLRRRASLVAVAGLCVLVLLLVGIGYYRDFDGGLMHEADCGAPADGAAVWSGCVKDGLQLEPGSMLAGMRAVNASLRDARMPGVNLSGARLDYADLTGASLQDANLRGAVLKGANLQGADLGGADLRAADLRNADLREADMSDARMAGAMLGNALWTDGRSCGVDAVGVCTPR